MSNALRTKGKSMVVWLLLALVILGIGGFGITSFSGGLRSVGGVGDTEIDVNTYARALRNEMRAVSAQIGQPIDMQQAQALRLDRRVQARLFSDAALDEMAARFGVSVGDDEVRRQITTARAFQGPDGRFNREIYRETLARQGLTEAGFEADLRRETARMIVEGAIAGGLPAPEVLVDTYTAYITETRSIAWVELTDTDLASPVPAPTEADLKAYYATHENEFTRPETRKIRYLWLRPEDLADEAAPDDAQLRAAYEARHDEFVTPERRVVERLIFADEAAAQAARDRLDSGAARFADLAADRGLTPADLELGEMTRVQLGDAGAAVFAAPGPGVVGPVDTDLGPALFSVTAILPAEETSFEDARAELAAEATLERARRLILERAPQIEDLLASGATLEDVARETPMKLARLSYDGSAPEDGIAAYTAFREAAETGRVEDFPELKELEDGGVFALQIDEIQPPAPIPYDEIVDRVTAAWTASNIHSRLLDRADEIVNAVATGQPLSAQGLITTEVGRLPRGGFVEGLPPEVSKVAFELEPGQAGVVDAQGRVLVVALHALHEADPADAEVAAVRETVAEQLSQSLSQDVVSMFARAAQETAGLHIDTGVINGVHAQMQ